MNLTEFEQIRTDIYAEPWNDPQLFPDLLARAIRELGCLATYQADDEPLKLADGFGFIPTPGAIWFASDLLRVMQNRARSGVPFGEPQELAP